MNNWSEVLVTAFPTRFPYSLYSHLNGGFPNIMVSCQCWSVYSWSVSMQTRKAVISVSVSDNGKFLLNVQQQLANHVEHIEADYLLIASGCSRQVVVDILFVSIIMHLKQIFYQTFLSVIGLYSCNSAWSYNCRSST